MRKSILVFISLGLLLTPACQDNANVEKEKEAILNVLQEAAEFFSEYNMEKLAGLHITDESAARYDGSKVYSGWDEIEALLKSYMDNDGEFENTNPINEKENVIIKVSGNSSWAICDNIWKWEENGQSFSFTNKQIAFLEKVDGEWKFAFNAFVQDNTEQERNKEIALKYHELNPDDIDAILTEDFIGRIGMSGRTWNREAHRDVWSNRKAEDEILHLIAEGDLVAIRFIRTGEMEGTSYSVDVMQFMRFENGKIAEIWEMFDQNQIDSQFD